MNAQTGPSGYNCQLAKSVPVAGRDIVAGTIPTYSLFFILADFPFHR